MLKSDNANGLFGFTSINPVVIPESSNVSVNIERQKGQFGSATVSWSVYKSSTFSLAVNDFIMATGTVVFDENESEKVYQIIIANYQWGRFFLKKLYMCNFHKYLIVIAMLQKQDVQLPFWTII